MPFSQPTTYPQTDCKNPGGFPSLQAYALPGFIGSMYFAQTSDPLFFGETYLLYRETINSVIVEESYQDT